MNIEIDFDKLTNESSKLAFSNMTENQCPEPSAATDSVSFPAMVPLKNFIFTAAFVVLGTTSPLGDQPIDLEEFRGLSFEFPSPTSGPVSASERYAKLRQEIVAAGIPFLNDDELREEIRDRKGKKQT